MGLDLFNTSTCLKTNKTEGRGTVLKSDLRDIATRCCVWILMDYDLNKTIRKLYSEIEKSEYAQDT